MRRLYNNSLDDSNNLALLYANGLKILRYGWSSANKLKTVRLTQGDPVNTLPRVLRVRMVAYR